MREARYFLYRGWDHSCCRCCSHLLISHQYCWRYLQVQLCMNLTWSRRESSRGYDRPRMMPAAPNNSGTHLHEHYVVPVSKKKQALLTSLDACMWVQIKTLFCRLCCNRTFCHCYQFCHKDQKVCLGHGMSCRLQRRAQQGRHYKFVQN